MCTRCVTPRFRHTNRVPCPNQLERARMRAVPLTRRRNRCRFLQKALHDLPARSSPPGVEGGNGGIPSSTLRAATFFEAQRFACAEPSSRFLNPFFATRLDFSVLSMRTERAIAQRTARRVAAGGSSTAEKPARKSRAICARSARLRSSRSLRAFVRNVLQPVSVPFVPKEWLVQ